LPVMWSCEKVSRQPQNRGGQGVLRDESLYRSVPALREEKYSIKYEDALVCPQPSKFQQTN